MPEKNMATCQELRLINSYELSPTQAGMLVHTLRHPNSGIDVEQVIVTLVKSIDPDGISAAWRKTVERHPIMRTSFRWEGTPQPMQDVWDCVEPPIEVLDWRELPTDEHKSRLSTFLSADRKRGFELSVPPAMRLTLVRTAEGIFDRRLDASSHSAGRSVNFYRSPRSVRYLRSLALRRHSLTTFAQKILPCTHRVGA